MRSPTWASGLRLRASATVICVDSFFDLVDHGQNTRQARLAGLGIDLAADVVLGAVSRFGSLLDRVFHGLDDDLAINRFLARDRVCDLQQLEPVGANACHACHR